MNDSYIWSLWKRWAILACAVWFGYSSLAFGVWQWRNPKANSMTFYTHYFDVIRLKKLERFQ